MFEILQDTYSRLNVAAARIGIALKDDDELKAPAETNDGDTRSMLRAVLEADVLDKDQRDTVERILAMHVLTPDGTALRWYTDEIDVAID